MTHPKPAYADQVIELTREEALGLLDLGCKDVRWDYRAGCPDGHTDTTTGYWINPATAACLDHYRYHVHQNSPKGCPGLIYFVLKDDSNEHV